MPTNDPIAAARREAKARARKGGTTHQQALDAIAREAGHANWTAMLAAPARRDPVRVFVENMRPHGGIAPDDEMKALAEDAIHGYLGEPDGTDVAEYVDRYEFRGDGFDVTPDAFQRDILENAIEGYVREMKGPDGADGPKRGPNHSMPFLMNDWPILEPPGNKVSLNKPRATEHLPSLADVERDAIRIMERQRASDESGQTISQWVADRMRNAAGKASGGSANPLAALAQLPMTTDNVAYAMDPGAGPYENRPSVTVRCPLHGKDGPERNPSLVIAGMEMRCMAGCGADILSSVLVDRLSDAAATARAFMARNDRSPVISGSSNAERGGMGGTYGLKDGSQHRLDTLACRLLPDGYPRWELGKG